MRTNVFCDSKLQYGCSALILLILGSVLAMLVALNTVGMMYQAQPEASIPDGPDAPPTLPAQPLHKPGEMLPLSQPQTQTPSQPQEDSQDVPVTPASFYVFLSVGFLISIIILALKVFACLDLTE